MSVGLYIAYVAACALIPVIPGPTVTLIVANSLTHGARAGLLNVAGTQLGLLAMLGVLVVGLASIIATMGWWFDWIRVAGAVYLVWIGWKLLRSTGDAGELGPAARPRGGFFVQGPPRALGNPPMRLSFGAFLPHIVAPAARRRRRGGP